MALFILSCFFLLEKPLLDILKFHFLFIPNIKVNFQPFDGVCSCVSVCIPGV